MLFMNCVMFDTIDEMSFLLLSDERAEHIKKYLKTQNGGEIFAAVKNAFLCKAKVCEKSGGYSFEVAEKLACACPMQTTVAMAFARPQIAQRILFECACFGVKKLCFYAAEKGERDYIKASLYSGKEYEKWFVKGAQQACNCFVPELECYESLEKCLESLPEDADTLKIAPDIYEATEKMSKVLMTSAKQKTLLAFGAERGFNNAERDILRKNGFVLANMVSDRVMRTDSALIAALSLLCAVEELKG